MRDLGNSKTFLSLPNSSSCLAASQKAARPFSPAATQPLARTLSLLLPPAHEPPAATALISPSPLPFLSLPSPPNLPLHFASIFVAHFTSSHYIKKIFHCIWQFSGSLADMEIRHWLIRNIHSLSSSRCIVLFSPSLNFKFCFCVWFLKMLRIFLLIFIYIWSLK